MEDAYKYLEATTDSDDFFVKDGCNDECEDEGWLLVERPVYGGVTDRKNSYGAQNAQPDTQKSQQEQEDGFVHVQPTLIVCARMCLHQHPTCTRALLWTWFGMLKLGELAATICWLKSLGFKESLMLEMALLLAFVTLCVMLTIRQVAAVLLSLVFTAIDGAWAYTMVALLMTALHVLAAGVGIVPMLSVADMSKAILYTVGVLCAQLRAQTSALFGEELVPFLLGVDIVNKKNVMHRGQQTWSSGVVLYAQPKALCTTSICCCASCRFAVCWTCTLRIISLPGITTILEWPHIINGVSIYHHVNCDVCSRIGVVRALLCATLPAS